MAKYQIWFKDLPDGSLEVRIPSFPLLSFVAASAMAAQDEARVRLEKAARTARATGVPLARQRQEEAPPDWREMVVAVDLRVRDATQRDGVWQVCLTLPASLRQRVWRDVPAGLRSAWISDAIEARWMAEFGARASSDDDGAGYGAGEQS